MRVALISDIHGNLTALDAVLDELAAEEIDRVACLGDVASDGPQPAGQRMSDRRHSLLLTFFRNGSPGVTNSVP